MKSNLNLKLALGLFVFAIVSTLGMSGCNEAGTSVDEGGTVGEAGLGSGIFANIIEGGDSRCPQGNGGVSYSTFIDRNNTGVYTTNDTITSVNYICNGSSGVTGAIGATGINGTSSSLSLVAASADQCADGGWEITATNGGVTSQGYALCNGVTGATGATGATGSTGAIGATGAAAPTSPLSLVQLIAPCGLASSAYKEEFMLFSDGSLLADFSASSDATTVRLSLIPDGSYIDTDNSGCNFQVSTSNNSRTISWGAGSSSDDPSGWSAGGWTWTMPVAASGAVAFNSN